MRTFLVELSLEPPCKLVFYSNRNMLGSKLGMRQRDSATVALPRVQKGAGVRDWGGYRKVLRQRAGMARVMGCVAFGISTSHCVVKLRYKTYASVEVKRLLLSEKQRCYKKRYVCFIFAITEVCLHHK